MWLQEGQVRHKSARQSSNKNIVCIPFIELKEAFRIQRDGHCAMLRNSFSNESWGQLGVRLDQSTQLSVNRPCRNVQGRKEQHQADWELSIEEAIHH
jgi:hypothetical protein